MLPAAVMSDSLFTTGTVLAGFASGERLFRRRLSGFPDNLRLSPQVIPAVIYFVVSDLQGACAVACGSANTTGAGARVAAASRHTA
jgi:hypothetical protein